jgi:ATP/ADP translocase
MKKDHSTKHAFSAVLRSRMFVLLWIAMAVEVIFVGLLTFFYARLWQAGVPVRFDGFSDARVFLANGSYLLNYLFLVLVIFFANSTVALKVFTTKGRTLSLLVMWATVAILAIAAILAATLFGLGSTLG